MMQRTSSSLWVSAIKNGLLGGAISLLLALVGMVVALGEKYIVSGLFTMGQVLAFAPLFIFSYTTVRRTAAKAATATSLLLGIVSGLSGGAVLAVLVAIGQVVNLRAMLVNASPELYGLLTFGLGIGAGVAVLLGFSMVIGLVSAGVFMLPARWRSTLIQTIIWVLLLGLLRDLMMTVIRSWGPIMPLLAWMYSGSGLTWYGSIFLLAVIGGLIYWQYGRSKQTRTSRLNPKQQRWMHWGTIAALVLIVLLLPQILGIFFSDILDNVGIYILMGLGLNIVVGFAGLLDLGYVAFYAIGAYTMGVLTSPELSANPMTFWAALPFALLVAVVAGVILGLPVLKMRGDYLAIVTLGFGEIVRLLVLSDWLRPWLGGSEGIQHIAHPKIGPLDLGSQQTLYYVILAFIGIAAFIAWRLKDSRLGRSWMALREDEDVARAMGINHVATKLMAFASGAFFAGLGGTIFAAKLSSAYPQSFQFLVSINVLSLIIIGGMGSIPGVIVGGVVLMGLPEILREFADYRYLVYGAALVAMMLIKPEGFMPEARRKLELHERPDILPGAEPPSVVENSGQ
jgi:branched-chain amino acid transport system permease protein